MGEDGKLYCKTDYIETYAPKCGGCKLAIEGGTGWGCMHSPVSPPSHPPSSLSPAPAPFRPIKTHGASRFHPPCMPDRIASS